MLKIAFGVWLAAASVDNVTTYQGITMPPATVDGVTHFIGESNPLLRPFQDSPAAMMVVASSVDVGSAVLWTKVGKTHRTVAIVALFGQAALRGYFAAKNLDHAHAQQAWIARSGLSRLP